MNESELFEYRKKLVDSVMFMKTTLNSLVGTYQILLMTINRFTDYTKVSHEIPLVPTLESVHLIDTLTAPISCVQDLQNRINIQVEPIDNRISEFVITDRQWLQDNILCLVTNAVKFSMKGTTVIRVFLTDPSPSAASSSSVASFPPDNNNLKSVHFEEEKCPDYDVEAGINSRSRSSDDRKPVVKFIRFQVEDHGIGITKTLQSREDLHISATTSASDFTKMVFSEPNIATKRPSNNAGGSGLGLFCLSKRVEALGGEYGVEEKKGDLLNMSTGTVFWFAIPYSPDNWKMRSVSKRSPSYVSSLEGKTSRGGWLEPRQGSISNILSVSSNDSKERSLHEDKVLFRESSFTIPRQSLSSAIDSDKLELPLITSARSTPKSSVESVAEKRDREKAVKIEGKKHVLVVDDSLPIVKMLKLMLEKNGFLVSTASNGLEAVECIRQSYCEAEEAKGEFNISPPIDTILMDIQMPIMDGIQATSMIRQIEKEVMKEPEKAAASGVNHLIVAMSASSEDGTVNAAYSAGADEFIAKPFNLLSFQRIIEEHYQRRQLSSKGSDPSSSDQGK
jgi:CheY-like chemotaxis protein/signal transduction histidine kinase